MKHLKKLFALVAVTALLTALFAGCTGNNNNTVPSEGNQSESAPQTSESIPEETSPEEPIEEHVEVITANVGALKGPTGMGLAKLMEDTKAGLVGEDNPIMEYHFTLEGAPDAVQGKLLNGELDIAVVPTNLASVMYNVTEGEVKIIAVSSMKVLSIMQASGVQVNSIADLAGKTLFTAGQGSTQEYVLEYLLRQNGLDPQTDLTIEFKSEQAEVATLLMDGQCDVALLPQPFATTVTTQNSDITKAIDVNEAWDAVSGGADLAMSCVVVRAEYIENYPGAVDAFLRDYAASIDFAMNNVDEAAALVGSFDIVPEPVAKLAIPACEISIIPGEGMKTSVEAYLNVLFEQNPKAVGGNLPDEGFYYLG